MMDTRPEYDTQPYLFFFLARKTRVLPRLKFSENALCILRLK